LVVFLFGGLLRPHLVFRETLPQKGWAARFDAAGGAAKTNIGKGERKRRVMLLSGSPFLVINFNPPYFLTGEGRGKKKGWETVFFFFFFLTTLDN